MSIKYLNKAWKTDLKAPAKMVLVALSDYADVKGECWPSLKSLSEKCGVKKTNLCYILKAFEKCNILNRKKRTRTNGSDTSTLYTILSYNINERLFRRVYNAIRNYEAINDDDTKMTQTNKTMEKQKEKLPKKAEEYKDLEPVIKDAISSQVSWEVFILDMYDFIYPISEYSDMEKIWWGSTVRKKMLLLDDRTMQNIRAFAEFRDQRDFLNRSK